MLTNTFGILVSTDQNIPHYSAVLQYYSAVLQCALAVVAAVCHFIGPVKLRRLSYVILLSMCAATIIRHFLNSDGPSVIGCFYGNIAFYAMLVYYQEHEENVPQLTNPKLS